VDTADTTAAAATAATAASEPLRLPLAHRRLYVTAALVALTGALWLLYGPGRTGYDASWALVWGRELAHGAVPDLAARAAPTPHPLLIAVAALLTPLGRAAPDALAALSLIGLAGLGAVAFGFGRRLFSAPVGLLFALLLLTCPLLVNGAGQDLLDGPFLALALGAAWLALARPGAHAAVLGLLAAAGLLRPEGWALALAYLAWVGWRGAPRRALPLVPLALLAPALWMGLDVASTGDPLYSLHGTQDLARWLGRPRGVERSLTAAPEFLVLVLGPVVAVGGVLGLVAALAGLGRRAVLPAVLLALGVGGFVVLGFARLPLLTRYLVLPAAMLALLCAVATLGWTCLPRERRRPRLAWGAGGAIVAIALVVSAPALGRELSGLQNFLSTRRAAEHDLRAVVTSGVATRLARRCPAVYVNDDRAVPLVAYWMGLSIDRVLVRGLGAPTRGLVLTARSALVNRRFSLEPSARGAPRPVPAGFVPVAGNASWRLAARC
jgi:hypothetical protein